MAELKGIPVASLPSASSLESDDQIIAYRSSDNQAYRANAGRLTEAANGNISDAFAIGTTYAVGDYCIYNDTLYKCTTEHTGSWSADDFEAVTVAEELNELNTNISKINQIEYGYVEFSNAVSSGSYGDISVTFDTPFRTTPAIAMSFATQSTNVSYASFALTTLNRSQTGFTIRLINASGGDATPRVSWVAVC